jgi:hypothetical protein
MKKVLKLLVIMAFFLTAPMSVAKPEAAKQEPPRQGSAATTAGTKGAGIAALERSARAGKYLYVLFFKDDDEQTKKMKDVIAGALKKASQRADSIAIKKTDPAEKPIVEKFGAGTAPAPLLLVVAPNGALTKGMARKCEEKALLDALVSPGQQKCLKALQDHKLVFVCIQNKTTSSNNQALKGVNDYRAAPEKNTDVITIDPGDPGEKDFIARLQADPKSTSARTIFLAPPGVILAQMTGPTYKDIFESAVKSASSGCGSSCSGGRCSPGGCK